MVAAGKGCDANPRSPAPMPETEAKYRDAVAMYAATDLSCAEISRRCGVSLPGFKRYVGTYCRHLMLLRNGVRCAPAKACNIKLSQRRGQRPATHSKYREAIAACDSIEYIDCNISQIARLFGLDPSGLSRQLRTHYPGLIERRERERRLRGQNDNLPRGTRPWCREQYAPAVELLRGDRYITVQEAAARCGVSRSGLEQHLVFYHKELIGDRTEIRRQAVGQQLRDRITGRGSVHAPKPATVAKYAEALRLYRTTSLSAMRIAGQTGVSRKGFYGYLRTWHTELICERQAVVCDGDGPADGAGRRKYRLAAKDKYAAAIARLKNSEDEPSTAAVAAEFGLHPDCFRQYLREHEPDLYARQGMVRTESGRVVSRRSMEKYGEAVRLFGATSESLRSLARRFGVNECSLRDFIKRHFPEVLEQRRQHLGRPTGENRLA